MRAHVSVSSRNDWDKLEKSENLILGGAVGAPEARNMLGMLVVMSLQLFIAFGDHDLVGHFLTFL